MLQRMSFFYTFEIKVRTKEDSQGGRKEGGLDYRIISNKIMCSLVGG